MRLENELNVSVSNEYTQNEMEKQTKYWTFECDGDTLDLVMIKNLLNEKSELYGIKHRKLYTSMYQGYVKLNKRLRKTSIEKTFGIFLNDIKWTPYDNQGEEFFFIQNSTKSDLDKSFLYYKRNNDQEKSKYWEFELSGSHLESDLLFLKAKLGEISETFVINKETERDYVGYSVFNKEMTRKELDEIFVPGSWFLNQPENWFEKRTLDWVIKKERQVNLNSVEKQTKYWKVEINYPKNATDIQQHLMLIKALLDEKTESYGIKIISEYKYKGCTKFNEKIRKTTLNNFFNEICEWESFEKTDTEYDEITLINTKKDLHNQILYLMYKTNSNGDEVGFPKLYKDYINSGNFEPELEFGKTILNDHPFYTDKIKLVCNIGKKCGHNEFVYDITGYGDLLSSITVETDVPLRIILEVDNHKCLQLFEINSTQKIHLLDGYGLPILKLSMINCHLRVLSQTTEPPEIEAEYVFIMTSKTRIELFEKETELALKDGTELVFKRPGIIVFNKVIPKPGIPEFNTFRNFIAQDENIIRYLLPSKKENEYTFDIPHISTLDKKIELCSLDKETVFFVKMNIGGHDFKKFIIDYDSKSIIFNQDIPMKKLNYNNFLIKIILLEPKVVSPRLKVLYKDECFYGDILIKGGMAVNGCTW